MKNELQQITFLDTPGHAAFSSMRARGANVTDLVVLVVAANDGVMPQTLEALNHARAAKVPILVAVNMIDHPNANSMRVRQQLQDKGLVPDDWGGDTIFADVSALTKQGVDKLLEMILLQADLLELKANPNRRAKGNVIESGLEPGGPIARVLVSKGTLRVSGVIICGKYYGKARALINEEGKRLKEAGPSVAVKVLGLNGVPDAGLEFSVCEDERTARDLATERTQAGRPRDGHSPVYQPAPVARFGGCAGVPGQRQPRAGFAGEPGWHARQRGRVGAKRPHMPITPNRLLMDFIPAMLCRSNTSDCGAIIMPSPGAMPFSS